MTYMNFVSDTKYYLTSQVHPVVQRLCDPIEGTDAARIAECLGKSQRNLHVFYIGGVRYEARSRGRSSPDTLASRACETPRR